MMVPNCIYLGAVKTIGEHDMRFKIKTRSITTTHQLRYYRTGVMGEEKKKLKEGMTVGRALYEASRDGKDEEVDAFLKQGAPVNYMCVMSIP